VANDFRLQVGFLTHPKTRLLKRYCGADGVLGMISLIEFCAMNNSRCTGDLAGMTNDEIEAAADWQGISGELIAGLEKAKFLDGQNDCWKIHDFEEHNPWVAGSKRRSESAKHAARMRWACDPHTIRNAPSPSPSPSPHQSAIELATLTAADMEAHLYDWIGPANKNQAALTAICPVTREELQTAKEKMADKAENPCWPWLITAIKNARKGPKKTKTTIAEELEKLEYLA